MEIKMTYSKSYYKHYFRKQRFLVLCQAQSGPHSFIDSLVLNLPSFLRSPSSLFSWSLKSLFPPTRLPPGYLPSAPSPLLQAVRILSVRGHTDPPLPTHRQSPYLATVLSAQRQQQKRQQRRHCPSPAPDLSLPEPLSPPPLSARLQDWVVSISPRADWLFRLCSSRRWGVKPCTANQRLPLRKPHPQHTALAVNPLVEHSETTPGSESIFLRRRGKEREKEVKTSVESRALCPLGAAMTTIVRAWSQASSAPGRGRLRSGSERAVAGWLL